MSPVVLPQGNLDITGGHGLGVRTVEVEAMCGRHDVPGHQGQRQEQSKKFGHKYLEATRAPPHRKLPGDTLTIHGYLFI